MTSFCMTFPSVNFSNEKNGCSMWSDVHPFWPLNSSQKMGIVDKQIFGQPEFCCIISFYTSILLSLRETQKLILRNNLLTNVEKASVLANCQKALTLTHHLSKEINILKIFSGESFTQTHQNVSRLDKLNNIR